MEAEAQINEWIDQGVMVDYLMLKYQLRPDAMMVGEREGFGRLSREGESVIMLKSPTGEEFPVYCSPEHVIENGESDSDYIVQIHTLIGDTRIALKPSKYLH